MEFTFILLKKGNLKKKKNKTLPSRKSFLLLMFKKSICQRHICYTIINNACNTEKYICKTLKYR